MRSSGAVPWPRRRPLQSRQSTHPPVIEMNSAPPQMGHIPQPCPRTPLRCTFYPAVWRLARQVLGAYELGDGAQRHVHLGRLRVDRLEVAGVVEGVQSRLVTGRVRVPLGLLERDDVV